MRKVMTTCRFVSRLLSLKKRFLYPSLDQCKKNCSVQRSTYLGSSPGMLGLARQTVPKKKGLRKFQVTKGTESESSQGCFCKVASFKDNCDWLVLKCSACEVNINVGI